MAENAPCCSGVKSKPGPSTTYSMVPHPRIASQTNALTLSHEVEETLEVAGNGHSKQFVALENASLMKRCI